MQTVRILGIDPGFDRLGICILDKKGGEDEIIYSSCISSNKKDSFEERLCFVGKSVEKIIKKYKPAEVAIEKIFFTKNQRTAINVAEMRGVCIYLAKINNLKISEYSPPEIKLSVVGAGNASKKDITFMLPKIIKSFYKENILDDEIDAIAIAITHSAKRKMLSFK